MLISKIFIDSLNKKEHILLTKLYLKLGNRLIKNDQLCKELKFKINDNLKLKLVDDKKIILSKYNHFDIQKLDQKTCNEILSYLSLNKFMGK